MALSFVTEKLNNKNKEKITKNKMIQKDRDWKITTGKKQKWWTFTMQKKDVDVTCTHT